MWPRSAALRDTKWPLSGRRVGASATGNPGFMPSHCHACIDLQAPFVIHYRFPRANLGPLHHGAKGVAVVTCPSSPGPEPGWPSPPRGDRSEVSIRRACALTSASLWLGAPGSASRPAISRPGTRCRFPIPPSLSTRVSRRKRLCLPPKGLPACPRSNARHRPGLSVRGGPMRADGAANSRIDPPDSARPDLGADATVCPRGCSASPASAVAEMHMRSRITRFHF